LAFDQKLAPGTLSINVLETIVHHIKETAATNKFHNFIHQPSDLYKLETSFIHRLEEQTVILIVHVPYVEAKNLLLLYELISLPIYYNFSSNASVIPDIGKCILIAIGNTEAFQTLSTSDLANSKHLGQTFFCEGCSVLQTNIVHECLGSLYLGSTTLIKQIANSGLTASGRISTVSVTIHGSFTQSALSLQTKFAPKLECSHLS
jgi:hypothetical protein